MFMLVLVLSVCCTTAFTLQSRNHAFTTTYDNCTELEVTDVGFNYVVFRGDLTDASATQFTKPIFSKKFVFGPTLSLAEIPVDLRVKLSLSADKHLVVLDNDEFQVDDWYAVCGSSIEKNLGKVCSKCALVQFCHCTCDTLSVRTLQVTSGCFPNEDNFTVTEANLEIQYPENHCTYANLSYALEVENRSSALLEHFDSWGIACDLGVISQAISLLMADADLPFDVSSTLSLVTGDLRDAKPDLMNFPDYIQMFSDRLNCAKTALRRRSASVAIPFGEISPGKIKEIQKMCKTLVDFTGGATTETSTSGGLRQLAYGASIFMGLLSFSILYIYF